MAEEQSAAKRLPHLAEPPGGGRQDHQAMQAAARRLVPGPGSTDDLAASGGQSPPVPHEPIPGERDVETLTHREPGSIGGRFTGADTPSPRRSDWLDERTALEHAREGGGDFVKTKS